MNTTATGERKHSRYAPSAAHRWMSCPGSVNLSEKCPKTKSKYAEEGTAAHRLAEICIKGEIDAAVYVGKEIKIPETEINYPVDEDMSDAVQVYLDTVKENRDIDDYTGIEEPFDLSWLYPGIFGTNDFYRYKHDEKKLIIYDYKHGKGIPVDAEWNPQLMIYALGAIKNICDKAKKPVFDSFVEDVELVVVQPRAVHEENQVKRWGIKAMDIMYWGINVVRPCAIAVDNKTTLCAGEHCQFCPALAVCPEVAKQATSLAEVAFDDVENAVLPSPENLPMETIAKILRVAPVFNEWAKAAEKYAAALLEQGRKIPGYKLVKKSAHRKWVSEEEVKKALTKFTSLDSLYQKPKLLSVAQMEKMLKVVVTPAALENLWEKPDIGYTIVPETDKREGIDSTPAQLAFDVEAATEIDFLAQ